MEIKPFLIEKWFEDYDHQTEYNLAETCVDSITLNYLLDIVDEDKDEFLNRILNTRLTYGKVLSGLPEFKEGVASLYETIEAEDVVSTNGASHANYLLLSALVEKGDRVISVCPTYSQLFIVPEALGADVQLLHLNRENDFLPDLDEMRKLANENTKLIIINSPHNPSGKVIPEEMMVEIAEIAKSVDAYVLCDEVYRGLNLEEGFPRSMVDIYEKGISVSGMSKVFSLAGLRMGWVASKSKEVIEECMKHKLHNGLSIGMLDEILSGLALRNADKLLKRNKAIVKENMETLEEWVKSEKHVTYFKPEAGTTAMIYYDFDISPRDFAILLKEKTGTLVTPGDAMDMEGNCLRIGFGYHNSELRDGLKNISDVIKSLVLV